MDLDSLAPALLTGSVIVLLAVVGVRFAGRLGLPGLLLYLVIGLLLGTFVPQLEFNDSQAAIVLGTAALVIILVEGGLTTPVSQLRPVLGPSLALATVGVAVTIGVVAAPLILLADLDPTVAFLLASALAATDAAAVFSVLRQLPLHPKLRALLESEAGFNDAPVIVLVLVLSTAAEDLVVWEVPLLVAAKLIGGALVGVLVGRLARWLFPRLALPSAGLYPIAVVAVLVGAYGAAEVVQASGLIATYVAAVIVGSTSGLPHRRSVLGFAEGLAWAAQIGLFVMLGLLANIEQVPASFLPAAVAGVTLVFVARPLAAVVSLAPFRYPAAWIAFVGATGLRGAVPIIFAAIPLGLGVQGSQTVFNATLVLVIALTLLQTPLLPWLSRFLGVTVEMAADEFDVESAPLDRMDASLLGFTVGPSSRIAGLYVTDLRLPRGAAVSLVVREGEGIVPDVHTRFRVGDQLMIVATEGCRAAAEGRLRVVSRDGRLGSWVSGLPEGGSRRPGRPVQP